ncbi:MAG TPA: hypothetical protein VLA48_02560 [Nitrososphaeraceae archaeon]|nr:hypothetical protein [Nitrososphaeraceae archaeon]
MKVVYFVTPTLLSHLDLFSMGGSDKADNEALVGKYNSGLCYSMALALRNNVDMSVQVFNKEYFSESEDRECETLYTIGTYTETCEQTDKEKELIQITKYVSKQSFFSLHCDDYGGGDFDPEIIPTGYSIKLGVDWQLWMLLRELFSNMIDENGFYCEDECQLPKYGTVFTLKFDEDSEFADIWNNRHLYVNEQEQLYSISDKVEVLSNEEGYLRIYKQNILVYQDKEIPSRYAYNIKMGTIDERRILSNIYGVEGEICDAIMQTKNEDFLREIITCDFKPLNKEFLSSRGSYYTPSELMHNVAFEIYEKHGEVKSYEWVIDAIKKLKSCKIGGKKITNVGDSVWAYSSTVTVETTPEPLSEPAMEVEGEILISPFSAEIKKYYDFELDVEVTKAKLKGSKCIADKFNNCLIVDNEFNVETDFAELIVQYLDLTDKDNVIKSMSKYICKLLKK